MDGSVLEQTALIPSLKLELARASSDKTCSKLSQTVAICEAKLLEVQVCGIYRHNYHRFKSPVFQPLTRHRWVLNTEQENVITKQKSLKTLQDDSKEQTAALQSLERALAKCSKQCTKENSNLLTHRSVF